MMKIKLSHYNLEFHFSFRFILIGLFTGKMPLTRTIDGSFEVKSDLSAICGHLSHYLLGFILAIDHFDIR
jgi:hypothetical protein